MDKKQNKLILGNKSLKQATEDISSLVEKVPGLKYFAALFTAKSIFIFYLIVMSIIVVVGMGLMGVNHPVGWGVDIINLVFRLGLAMRALSFQRFYFYSAKNGEPRLPEQPKP